MRKHGAHPLNTPQLVFSVLALHFGRYRCPYRPLRDCQQGDQTPALKYRSIPARDSTLHQPVPIRPYHSTPAAAHCQRSASRRRRAHLVICYDNHKLDPIHVLEPPGPLFHIHPCKHHVPTRHSTQSPLLGHLGQFGLYGLLSCRRRHDGRYERAVRSVHDLLE